ncbi:MAG: hypothetical protein AABX69_04420, partial [Nanoarchaeota archaeon]
MKGLTERSLDSLFLDIAESSQSILRKYFCSVALAAANVIPSAVLANQPVISCKSYRDCTRQGGELYDHGRYQDALPFFQEAYQQAAKKKDRTAVLKNISALYVNLRQPQLAREYLRLYLADNPTKRKEGKLLLDAFDLYAQGLELYKKGNYGAAVEVFKNVYKRVSHTRNLRVTILVDIAQSYEQLGKEELATEYYNLYLSDAGARAQERSTLEAKIAAWSKRQTTIAQSAKQLEGVPPKVSPPLPPLPSSPSSLLPSPLPLPSPPLSLPSPPSLQTKAEPLAATIAPPPEAAVERMPKETFFQQHTWSVLSGSAGLASILGGAVTGYFANAKYNELKEGCAPGCPESEINVVASRGRMANGLFITGGALTVLAAVLYSQEGNADKPVQAKESRIKVT